MSPEAEQLVIRVTEDIRRLRLILDEPVTIPYGRNNLVDIEIRPIDDDDRVLVGFWGRGFTTVNYTSEGLILDVTPEGLIDILHTAAFYKDDLEEAAT